MTVAYKTCIINNTLIMFN